MRFYIYCAHPVICVILSASAAALNSVDAVYGPLRAFFATVQEIVFRATDVRSLGAVVLRVIKLVVEIVSPPVITSFDCSYKL